ncbi:MAG: tRNA 2-selenouridine(34) synthase MnmH [Burkholderiaceae bacterium]|nr:tRNA 2-selenouridine(34) synthase MnmH [Burkholderiaceae bacterium]
MSMQRICAKQALADLASFDAVIDTRSESEFALDHLPGALNWPSLRDAERERVGLLDKQAGPFEARKLGAALVARNIATHTERACLDKPKSWKPLVYCWRGGQRSGALALVLGQIGFRVTVIEGGYKAFRAALLADLPRLVAPLRFEVICGPTGSGKTRLLHALAQAGAQTLDLEALASHRASVLGVIPGQPQPAQKRFDTLLWQALAALDAARPVFVEAESKKVGNLSVPECLMAAMRASPCVRIDLSETERVALLLEDYPYFVQAPDFFCQRLTALTALRGRAVVESWIAAVRAGQLEAVVRELLARHYDPGYEKSTRHNFAQFDQARTVTLQNRSAAALGRAAKLLRR